MEQNAANKLQRWWKKLPSCRRCESKFYKPIARCKVYKCGDCNFNYFMDKIQDLDEDDEEDPLGYPRWRINVRMHKLYTCGIKNRLWDKTYAQAKESGILRIHADSIATVAVKYALNIRSECHHLGAKEATKISLEAGTEAIAVEINNYSSATISTSVGGAGGV